MKKEGKRKGRRGFYQPKKIGEIRGAQKFERGLSQYVFAESQLQIA